MLKKKIKSKNFGFKNGGIMSFIYLQMDGKRKNNFKYKEKSKK